MINNKIKVAVNGYGVIGKRVADLQPTDNSMLCGQMGSAMKGIDQ